MCNKYNYTTKILIMQLKAYKFRLYPTKEQEQTFAQFFGAKRWIFNHYLHENKQLFASNSKHLSNYDVNNDITKLKKLPETEWLRQIDDHCLKNASEDLANAYQGFFNSITGKRKGKPLSAPKFKSKYDKQSYRTRGVKVNFNNNIVTLPKIKNVSAVIHRRFSGTIKYSTITKNAANQYYISILVEEAATKLPKTGIEIGIDLGLKDIIILSNGLKFQSPRIFLAKTTLKLKHEQRKLSRMKKSSKNYAKQRLKIAKAYQRISNMRDAYYHEISHYLVSNFDAIYMENLNVAGMMQNQNLSRAIAEASWSTLSRMIQYKSSFYEKTFHQIDRFAASSKTCSCCGHKLEKLSLKTRTWTCPSCKVEHDRDLNAAQNIKNFGQLDVYDQLITSQASGEEELNIPKALVKRTSKTKKSAAYAVVGSGTEQAASL